MLGPTMRALRALMYPLPVLAPVITVHSATSSGGHVA
jgi:hypothetical protein